MDNPNDPTAIRIEDINSRTMAKLVKAYQNAKTTTDRLPYTTTLDGLAAVAFWDSLPFEKVETGDKG